MSIIGQKRLQQGVFEALAGMNRVVGSGGGSGLGLSVVTQVHGGNAVGNPGKNYSNSTSYQLVQDTGAPAVSATLTVVVGYARPVLLLGDISVQGPSTGSQINQSTVFLDGSQATNAPLIYGGSQAISTQIQTLPVLYSCLLAPGSHTLDLRIIAGNPATYLVSSFDMYALLLG